MIAVGADIIRPRVKACISKHYPFIVNINFKQIQSERSDPKLLIVYVTHILEKHTPNILIAYGIGYITLTPR